MSQQAFTEFIRALPDNPELAEKLRVAVSENEGSAAIDAVARIASEAGYDVNAVDANAFRANALKAMEDGELDEESLSKVSGGIIGVDDVIIGGAIVAVIGGAAGTAGLTGAAIGTQVIAGVINKDFGNKVTEFFSKW